MLTEWRRTALRIGSLWQRGGVQQHAQPPVMQWDLPSSGRQPTTAALMRPGASAHRPRPPACRHLQAPIRSPAGDSKDQVDSPELSDEQIRVLELVKTGKNVFYTGNSTQGDPATSGEMCRCLSVCCAPPERSFSPPTAPGCPLATHPPSQIPDRAVRRRCGHRQVLPAQPHHRLAARGVGRRVWLRGAAPLLFLLFVFSGGVRGGAAPQAAWPHAALLWRYTAGRRSLLLVCGLPTDPSLNHLPPARALCVHPFAQVAVTAATGIAATHIQGSTVHSVMGCGVPRNLEDFDRM